MISKIIQKEKKKQEEYFYSIGFINGKPGKEFVPGVFSNCHKQSLINLKEYMEEQIKWLTWDAKNFLNVRNKKINQIKKDIDELTKMIEIYDANVLEGEE